MTIARRRLLAQLLLGASAQALLGSRGAAHAETVIYTYDDLGRIATVTYDNGATITYTYDATGNRTALVQTPPNSVQATLSASPTSIANGQSTTLTWTTNFASSASINQGVGTVTPTAGGTVIVSPTSNTTYTITAQGPYGPATAQASVVVHPNPTSTLTASPASITEGSSSTLSWTSTNATSASINQSIGSVTPVASGSTSVSPLTTTTYTLTVNGPGGQHQSQATVTVTPNNFTQTIQVTGTGSVNLRSLANNAGYSGTQNANVTFEIGSGVTITGGAGGGIAIDSGTWPTGSHTIQLALVVKNGAIVRGGGGAGGAGGSPFAPNGSAGEAGGDAISCRLPMTVTIQSGAQVRGGGGGGGGGAAGDNSDWVEPQYGAGGGGGGGAPNGPGGAGGSGAAGAAGNGQNGTTSGGAFGGGSDASNWGSGGGSGANYGVAGGTGFSFNGLVGLISGGVGGPAGYCIRKNGHTVPVTNNGTTSGTIG